MKFNIPTYFLGSLYIVNTLFHKSHELTDYLFKEKNIYKNLLKHIVFFLLGFILMIIVRPFFYELLILGIIFVYIFCILHSLFINITIKEKFFKILILFIAFLLNPSLNNKIHTPCF